MFERRPPRAVRVPRLLREAPALDSALRTPSPTPRYALLINPFYPKDAHASFVFGFDHDGPEVFERTAEWVERHRLECATFHILTPYPGTPLFRQMEREGRILHRDWDLYDTAHVVFRPRGMSPEQLAAGYAWCYQHIFSLGSIWRRRPPAWGQALPYLAMSLLYKKSNRVWPWLIRHRLTHRAWRPLVELSRRRHVRWRKRLAEPNPAAGGGAAAPVYAGV